MKPRLWSRSERRLLLATVLVALALPLVTYLLPLLRARNGTLLRADNEFLLVLAWSPDSRLLAAGGGGRSTASLAIWDATTHQLKHSLSGHTSLVYQLSFSPNGQHLVSASNQEVCVWNTRSGNLIHTFPGSYTSQIEWDKTGQRLFFAGRPLASIKDYSLSYWQFEIATGIVTPRSPSPRSDQVSRDSGLEKSPDGKFRLERVLVPGITNPVPGNRGWTPNFNRIQIRDAKTREVLYEALERNFTRLWWQDGQHLRGIARVTSSGSFLEARLWEFDCQTRRESWQRLDVKGFRDVRVSLDRRWFAWNEGRNMRLFDLKTQKFVTSWDIGQSPFFQSEFSPDSRTLSWTDGSTIHMQSLEASLRAE